MWFLYIYILETLRWYCSPLCNFFRDESMVNICSAKSFNFSLCATYEITWDDLSTDFWRWTGVHRPSQTPSATIAMLVMCLEANWPALGLRLISVGKHKCLRRLKNHVLYIGIACFCLFIPLISGFMEISPNHQITGINSAKTQLKLTFSDMIDQLTNPNPACWWTSPFISID